jgi:hypothetical protein
MLALAVLRLCSWHRAHVWPFIQLLSWPYLACRMHVGSHLGPVYPQSCVRVLLGLVIAVL